MRILVTGATGFLGSHLVHGLVRGGHAVAVLARPGSDLWRIHEALDAVTLITGDLLDLTTAPAALAQFEPDTVAHLAWFGVGSRLRNDARQVTANLNSTSALLRLAQDIGVRHWVGLGSQAEYGVSDEPITEETPLRPTTLYGAAKLCAFMLTRQVCADSGMRCVWLRLFAAYGPKDSPEWLIPYVILSALRGRRPALTEGTQRWDYLYVADAADAICGTIESGAAEGAFNLASGETQSIRAIVERIRDLIDPSLPLGFGEVSRRSDQILSLTADVRRLEQAIGWSPRVSLQEGLERTVAWYREHLTSFPT